ncbi:MAG: nitrous oxide reductase accessory protein NosL [Desulfobacteraceae bacterium]
MATVVKSGPPRILVLSAFLLILIWGSAALAEDAVCQYCGMKRSQYPHSWVVITQSDDSVKMVCSVHCAAIDMALHTHKQITQITVADYRTHRQIPAEKAFWVVGGDRIGVMTARAKWAFKTKSDALLFIKHHGGILAVFDEVIKAAFEDMYQDTLMIRKKHRMLNLRKNASKK